MAAWFATGTDAPLKATPGVRLYADKYADGQIFHDHRHAWLQVTPDKIVSWDFPKMGS